jgi:hypothetical protein
MRDHDRGMAWHGRIIIRVRSEEMEKRIPAVKWY